MYRVLELQEKVAQETKSVQTSMSLKDGFARFGGRVIIGLRTKGCSWARSAKGGCTHCRIPFSEICCGDESNILPQLLQDFLKYKFEEHPVLCLYTPGSFFDDDEISPALRIQLLEIIARETAIKRLSVESRPDFITEEKIAVVREALPDIEIEVGLGLDSANDKVRNIFINKGLRFESYARACEILKEFNIIIVTYVLIKPPFLTESDAIIDAIRSTKKAFESGSSIVSFEPMSVQKDTIVYQLYRDGLYRPPWLWSVIDVVRNVSSLGEIRIGIFLYPPAVQYASNCERCTPTVLQKVQEFNKTGNLQELDLFCTCQDEWREKLKDK